MRKTTRRVFAAAVAGAMLLTACGDAPEEETPEVAEEPEAEETDAEEPQAEETDAEEPEAEAADYHACMITDQGGIDDGSFNETAYNGLVRAESELGVQIDYLESQSETDFQPNMQAFVQQDCDIIIPVGFLLAEVTGEAAEASPDQHFAIVDYPNAFGEDGTSFDNVLGLTFNTAEAAFMAGYAAAAYTETGTVGTYGGLNIPTVTIFMDGFLAGVNYHNEQKGTEVEVLGWDGEDGQFTNDFTSLDLGRSVTETLMDNGADVIMPVAGPVGGGSAAAIQDRGEGVLIWVDTDGYESTDFQDIMFTSVMKQMDVAVFDAIKAGVDGTFEGGDYVGTLENDGVALAPFHDFEDDLPEGLQDELAEIEQQIIDGSLQTTP